jgi:hypothetical protein
MKPEKPILIKYRKQYIQPLQLHKLHCTKNSIIYTTKMFLTEPVFYMIIKGTKEQPPSFAASYAE